MEAERQIAEYMRQGMRHLASGVAIVSTRSKTGDRYAMTVSSVTSLTDSPPSLLVCINQTAQTHKVLQDEDQFSVSILAHHQREISERCATAMEMAARFDIGQWRDHGDSQIPYLDDALSVFFCRAGERINYGSHMIVIGNIESVVLATVEVEPLVYCRGKYCSLT
jgi:flavin reductase (DIM6/NTAB) family NADH-FMN oxidoreductase RutF